VGMRIIETCAPRLSPPCRSAKRLKVGRPTAGEPTRARYKTGCQASPATTGMGKLVDKTA
ncbi:MAG: hypothetical protein WBL81_05300, partial [Pseudolabrys sp.]